MRPDYIKWLAEQKYADNTQVAQIHRVRKVEEYYGNLDEHFANGTYEADSRAIGQILGYMGDLHEEEGSEKPVRGILVAHDFDKRAKAAARVVPSLTLQKYSIEFNFTPEE